MGVNLGYLEYYAEDTVMICIPLYHILNVIIKKKESWLLKLIQLFTVETIISYPPYVVFFLIRFNIKR